MTRERRGVATALVGAGRLARSLAPALDGAGHRLVAVLARRPAAARRVARSTPGAHAHVDPRLAVAGARVVLLAVPDRELRRCAMALAALGDLDWRGRVVLHHAGALGPEPLAPLARRGAAVGVLHPLQVLGGSERSASLLAGAHARIEGDPRAVRAARRLARGLGLVPLPLATLDDERRAAYHAAASVVANDLVALLSIGVELLERAGLAGERRALAALVPLARGALAQLDAGGLAAALTGPAARGDRATLAAHRRALGQLGAEERRVHDALARRLGRLTGSSGPAPTRKV
jgi:predicted short-subunit dehydrogenase-like oxidoreductase (DUF2520 family)